VLATDNNEQIIGDLMHTLPSVLWRCWLSIRKSIRSVKNWVMRCYHTRKTQTNSPLSSECWQPIAQEHIGIMINIEIGS